MKVEREQLPQHITPNMFKPTEPRSQLQAFLESSDIPCPSCDYNLRGLKGDICPECSQQLVLRVSLAEPRQRAYISALIALAMGAGFHGLLLAYFSIYLLFGRYGNIGGYSYLVLTGAPFLVEGACLYSLVRRRRSFQRLSAAQRGRLVVGAWLLTLIGFVIFTLMIR